jgi:ATP synthase I chain
VTTPAQDAPLVFPSVAFRPVRLFVICLVLTAIATLGAGLSGHLMLGVFFGIGLLLGLLNALLVSRSVGSITAKDHPLKSSMALNSASRLAIITIVGLVLAYLFRPAGIGVLFGLALFQVLLVLSTALPVWKKLRTAEPTAFSTSPAGQPAASESGVLKGSEGNAGDE